jgi:uncharacterized protein (UPF0335 family)
MIDSGQQLRSFINRILRLKSEQDELGSVIRDIYAEAKGNGFDKTVLGKVVAALRAREKHGDAKMSEQDALFETYMAAFESGTLIATHAHETPDFKITTPAPVPAELLSRTVVSEEWPDIPPNLDRRQRLAAS